ncbi:MAG: AmmeMemoRadiSam system protein B [Patescibacteria group bacterium]
MPWSLIFVILFCYTREVKSRLWFWIFWTSCLLIVFGGVFAIGATLGKSFFTDEEQEEISDHPVYSSGSQTIEFFDSAYDQAENLPAVKTQSLISAHHLIVAKEIATLFESVSSGDVKTIILVSPNHLHVGISPAQVSYGDWETPYGLVEGTKNAEKLVMDGGVIAHEEMAAPGEHGIGALTPFIARSFPKAKIIPLIIDDALTDEEAKEVVETLYDVVPNALLIASMDMSHYLPHTAAAYHDAVTSACLDRGEACLSSVDLEVDANAVLSVLGAWNSLQATEVWSETYHGDTISMGLANAAEDNTSHILGYFGSGLPEYASFASIHFVGDIMLDRGVRKAIDAAGGDVNYPWQYVDRFLSGSHLRVGNLEGTVNEQESTYTYDPPFRFVFDPSFVEAMKPFIDVVSLANNHVWDVGRTGETETHTWLDALEIPWFASYNSPIPRYDQAIGGIPVTLIGYHTFVPDEATLLEMIATAHEEGRFVIVLPHWGVEYEHEPQTYQRNLAEAMIDAGADLIMGGHAHVPQGIEVIDGVPVIYSLGNFVFDQEIFETWKALTAGVIITDDSIEIHLLPVTTNLKAPEPMEDGEAEALLEHLADFSDPELHEQIINGQLNFLRYEVN